MLDCIGVSERHISVNRWYRWSVVYFNDVAVVFLLRDGKLNVVVTGKKEKNCSVHIHFRPVYGINS